MRHSRHHRQLLGAILVFSWVPAAYGNPFITVQPVFAGTTVPTDIARDELFARTIYAQISIDINFLAPLTSSSVPNTLEDQTAGGFFNSAGFDVYLKDSSWQAAPILTVWYVTSMTSGAVGESICQSVVVGAGVENRCGAWVASVPNPNNDTVAHELTHVLTGFYAAWQVASDLMHSTDPYNILAPGNIRHIPSTIADINPNGLQFDRIEPIQVSNGITGGILGSGFVQAVPEAGSLFTAAAGLVLVLIGKLRIKTP
jgi:hypothetical protein